MIKRTIQFLFLNLALAGITIGQPATGYYEGTDGLEGEELKAALNGIISGHIVYSYFNSKYVLEQSDADPNNPDNVIMVYTGRSHPNDDYGTGGDQLNREHVWAKSHGSFDDLQPMHGDVHNLKPADASVNSDKSNKDYDWGGQQHPEATGCKFTDDTWEPRDEVKGDIARIIFYMSTRYEGENGELDFEVVDAINTSPLPEHGKLSTLLEWNLQDPPDDFEMNRNNVIERFQKNRNPFIDHPQWAGIIWGGAAPNPISITDLLLNPEVPVPDEPVDMFVKITTTEGSIQSATLKYGTEWNQLVNSEEMDGSGEDFEASLPAQPEGTTIYFRIEATDGANTHHTPVYKLFFPDQFNGTLTSIYDIQGQAASSPYEDQIVSTAGVVTANFGQNFFIQDGYGDWNGMFIYDPQGIVNPDIGDSVIVTGKVVEYYEKTEITNISDFYFIASNKPLPEPKLIATGEAGEAEESVLVKVENANCTFANYWEDYFMWRVDDGSGELKIHNTSRYEYEPVEGQSYDITGPLNYDFDEWKVELRFEDDVKGAADITKPEVSTVTAVTSTVIRVDFSEAVEEATAQARENYAIDHGVVVDEASQHELIKSQVFLTVSEMSGGDYELSVQNIEDLNGNVLDPVVVPFTYTTGIGETILDARVNIHPVPVRGEAILEFYSTGNTGLTIDIYNVTGKLMNSEVHQAGKGNHTMTVGMGHYPPGIYFIRLTTDTGSLTRKVVKQ
jgi:endonuclease I